MTFSAAAAYKGDAGKGDPEDMLVAALSSCHMLSFLAIAAKKKVTVDVLRRRCGGLSGKGRRKIVDRARDPASQGCVQTDADAATLAEIHHLAHEACFIANSVKTEVTSNRANLAVARSHRA